MILGDLFSRRHKKANGLFPDVFIYEPMPEKLKITLTHIFQRLIKACTERRGSQASAEAYYERIHQTICEEHSYMCLVNSHSKHSERVLNFFLQNDSNILANLDIVNMMLDYASYASKQQNGESIAQYIEEVNQRMLEHGFGYQYEDDLLVRIDSKHTHSEIIKPALLLLQDKRFKNADDEFRKAFEAYKNSKYEEAIREASNSVESTMKIICNIKKYGLPVRHNSTALIEHLRKNDFIKNFQVETFNALAKCLEAAPIVRNNQAGHGRGHEERNIDESLVSYALNMAASTIKFLVEIVNLK